jgi:hypothetical protein
LINQFLARLETEESDSNVRQIAIAVLFSLAAGLVPSALALVPRDANAVAVLMFTRSSEGCAAQLVAAADGTLIATTHGGRVAVARFASGDFSAQLYRLGALLVLDAGLVASCLTLTRAMP